MSRGIGVRAVLIAQDNLKIVYEYGSFNWNKPECCNPNYETDGMITIDKEALPTIEFHRRNSKKRNAQKSVVKHAFEKYTREEMLQKRMIIIENSKYCWIKDEHNFDVMALAVVSQVISHYAKTAELPETISMLS